MIPATRLFQMQQIKLFQKTIPATRLIPRMAEPDEYPWEHCRLFDTKTADALFTRLANELDFAQNTIFVGGRAVLERRLTCWQSELCYTYSGTRRMPAPFSPTVLEIKAAVETKLGVTFDGLLCNLYRNGHDQIGWHSDDEKDLRKPNIASLSFGAPRKFRFRHKYRASRDAHRAATGSGWVAEYVLQSGDLVHMYDNCQSAYQHSIPCEKTVKEPRINLTFRVLTN